ncbi:MAG: hypothetical protein JWO68_3346, partial [Actinomycetia bacterium]|nr:hypothetical protein [Actinomycetes bacterium]
AVAGIPAPVTVDRPGQVATSQEAPDANGRGAIDVFLRQRGAGGTEPTPDPSSPSTTSTSAP